MIYSEHDTITMKNDNQIVSTLKKSLRITMNPTAV